MAFCIMAKGSVEERVTAYITQNHMIQAGQVLFLGVSGGADSMVMLDLLLAYRKTCPYSPVVLHLHHGIRGEEADRDLALTEAYCRKRGVLFQAWHKDIPALAAQEGMGLEEAGRLARRELFQQALEGARREGRAASLALAHHMDDQAETVLHHLLRGSGLRGLSGMAPKGSDIIRPLLCLEKKEILSYAQAHAIPYGQDSTNKDTAYLRNRLRHEILPLLEKTVQGGSIRHMAQTALLLREAEDYLSIQAQKTLDRLAVHKEEGLVLPQTLCQEHPALQSYVVRLALEEVSARQQNLGLVQIRQVLNLLENPKGGRRLSLPYGIQALGTPAGVFLKRMGSFREKEEPAKEAWPQVPLVIPGVTKTPFGSFHTRVLERQEVEIQEKTYTKWLDYDKIKGVVCIRARRSGDFFFLEGGGKKLLRRFFVDEKIEKAKRDTAPVLAAGSEVLWVVPWRIGSRGKVTQETRRVLEITWEGPGECGNHKQEVSSP